MLESGIALKRILLTVHKFLPQHSAGTEVLTLKVAQELQRRGNEVLVVTANPPDKDARHTEGKQTSQYVYEGVPVHVVEEPLRTKGYTFAHEYYHPAIAADFKLVLDKFKPDIVHIFHAQNLSAAIVEVAKARNIPVVCSLTDFWFFCPIVQLRKPDGQLCTGPTAAATNCLSCYTPQLLPAQPEFERAVKQKYPAATLMVEKHLPQISKQIYSLLHSANTARKFIPAATATMARPAKLRSLLNQTDAVMVPTKLMRDLLVKNGINAALLRHVPFGIDANGLLDNELGPNHCKTLSSSLRIGFIGTVSEHKGPDLLVDAFQMLSEQSNVQLKIYGNMQQFPEYAAELKSRVKKENLASGKIQFLGAFPNNELGRVFSEIDILVVPSRWYENTPLVMQSAFMSGTPLIATNLGGMSELIEHGKNGLLFNLNDPVSLYEQLLRLIKEPELLPHLVAGIDKQRTILEMVDDIEAVYGMSW